MSFGELVISSLSFIFYAGPIVLGIVMAYVLFNLWVSYVRAKFMASQEFVLLRIIPPRDILKTPMAMELFLNGLHQTGGESTPIDRFWKGKMRAWFSLEIVSHEGEVAFYIWTRKGLVNYLQSQIYAQFPGIEIMESYDYTDKIDYPSDKYEMFGIEYELVEPDPVPIKTYVDYGLDDSNIKEEYKTDPITPTLEFLGSLRPGEHGWLQFIVRAHKKEDKDPKKWFGKTDRWKDEAKELIIKMKQEQVYAPDKDKPAINLGTKGQQDKINAIERSLGKLPFDVGVRSIYIAEKGVFNPVNNGAFAGILRQFGSGNLNGFKPGITTSFDYWWQDPWGSKLERIKKNIYEAYIERDYFWKKLPRNKPRKKMILNCEELATVFHFPGSVAHTPSLTRIQSRKGEAPPNLPI